MRLLTFHVLLTSHVATAAAGTICVLMEEPAQRCWSPKCNNFPKCNKVLNVIIFGPKCNKALNVITFGPKCNKPPMQSFNCANIEMLKWQLLHQRILWPIFMEYCGLTVLISVFLFVKDVGWKALATKPYWYWCAFGIKLTDAKATITLTNSSLYIIGSDS